MATINLQLTGTHEECDAFVAKQIANYHPAGYGTWFNGPPNTKRGANGQLVTHCAPTDHGDGKWTVRGSRMDSCD
jgi:hypothetical protein